MIEHWELVVEGMTNHKWLRYIDSRRFRTEEINERWLANGDWPKMQTGGRPVMIGE